ncbi:unnamed protein product [Coffea canephora]|uniref:Uncharacterized protein n=1 Tax=Coffea canephora TaxID=49390 RepID=A0A068V2B0_COFCA|nr:unnamed protein product [Coffea canephora]
MDWGTSNTITIFLPNSHILSLSLSHLFPPFLFFSSFKSP